jgi:hypothetical protein
MFFLALVSLGPVVVEFSIIGLPNVCPLSLPPVALLKFSVLSEVLPLPGLKGDAIYTCGMVREVGFEPTNP